MQTDEIAGETLSLEGSYNDITEIDPNERLVVEFKAKSDNQINLELWKQGELKHTFEVIPNGNDDFTKQTVVLEHSQALEFDQLKFSGTLDSEESFLVYAITVLEGGALVDTELSEHRFTIQEDDNDPKPYIDLGVCESGSSPYHALIEDDLDYSINSHTISEYDNRIYKISCY